MTPRRRKYREPRKLWDDVIIVAMIAFVTAAALWLARSRSSFQESKELPSRASVPAPSPPPPPPPSPPAPPRSTGYSLRTFAVRTESPAGNVPQGAVYDVNVSPTFPGTRADLYDGLPTTVQLSIGAPDPNNALPVAQPIDAAFRAATGPLRLSVLLVCEVCRNGRLSERSIVYNPVTQQSTPAAFTIIPDRTVSDELSRAGNLVFLISADSVGFDRVVMPVSVGATVEPDSVASGTQSNGLARRAAGSDVDLIVTSEQNGTQVRMTLRANNEDLLRHLRRSLPAAAAGASWDFSVALSRGKIDSVAYSAYGQLKKLMDNIAENEIDLTQIDGLISDYSRSELTLDSQTRMATELESAGNRLYDALFRPVPGTTAEKVIGAIEGFPSATPLRLSVFVDSGFYLPWQLLKRPHSDSSDFWGFKFVLNVLPVNAWVPPRTKTLVLAKNDPTPFALFDGHHEVGGVGWFGTEEQHRVAMLLEDPQPTPLASKQAALDYLTANHARIKLLLTYTHATSATRLTFDGDDYAGGFVNVEGGSRLMFSDAPGQALTALELLDLQSALQTGDDPAFLQRPLVILNACETASAPFYSTYSNAAFDLSLPVTMMTLGARTVIGTDSPVLALSAAQFEDFLVHELFKGVEVAKALHTVRREFLNKHNPIGLLYSLYGDPSATLTIGESTAPEHR